MQALALIVAAFITLGGAPANRLAATNDPVLRFHAYDPAPWQPFDPAAYDLAEANERLVLIYLTQPNCTECTRTAYRLALTPELDMTIPVMIDASTRPFTTRRLRRIADAMNPQGEHLPLMMLFTPDGLPLYAERQWRAPGSFEGMPQVIRRVDRLWRQERTSVRIFGRLMLTAAEPGRPVPVVPGN